MNPTIAEFADKIAPYIAGPITTESVTDAVLAWFEDESAAIDRIRRSLPAAVQLLAGTYDEFRAEAGLAG